MTSRSSYFPLHPLCVPTYKPVSSMNYYFWDQSTTAIEIQTRIELLFKRIQVLTFFDYRKFSTCRTFLRRFQTSIWSNDFFLSIKLKFTEHISWGQIKRFFLTHNGCGARCACPPHDSLTSYVRSSGYFLVVEINCLRFVNWTDARSFRFTFP